MRHISTIRSLINQTKQPFTAVKGTHSNAIISSIPFNFAGVDDTINDTHNSKITKFLHQIFGNKLEIGFKHAYECLIEGLAHNDLELFQDILEPQLYVKAENALKLCQKNQLTIRITEQSRSTQTNNIKDNESQSAAIKPTVSSPLCYNPNNLNKSSIPDQTSLQSLKFNKLQIHNGVCFERSKNLPNLHKQSLEMFGYAMFNLYSEHNQIQGNLSAFKDTSILNMRPIISIDVFITSNKILQVIDKHGNIVAGETTDDGSSKKASQIHKLTFETDPGTNSQFEQTQLFGLFSGLNKKAPQYSSSAQLSKEQIFKDIFLGSESQWKIADIDSALSGNPFTKQPKNNSNNNNISKQNQNSSVQYVGKTNINLS